MPNATLFVRWPLVLLLAAGFALPLRAATPSVSGSAAPASRPAGPSPLPADPPAPAASPSKLPGNDPSLFSNSIPVNTGPAVAGPAPGEEQPSTSFAVNLLKLLVKRGILTQSDSDELTREAENDAATARAQSQADATAASQVVATQVTEKVSEMTPPPPSPDDVRVPYVPDIVKQEITDDVKRQVMAQARAENWASPRAIPDWVPHFRFTGDVRTMYQGDFFPNTNDATGAFPDFNAINTGAPFDVAGTEFSPQWDVNQDRELFRERARIGADVDLDDGWSLGIRLASGQDDQPVSENQTLGAANNGQGGDFSKYQIWLDRSFLKYEYQASDDANKDFSITVGRMDNPFFSTSMIWATDLGFDGLTLQGRYPVAKGVVPFLTVGGYPVFDTDFNFSTNQPSKYQSEDKYLFAAQLGTDWTINKELNAKVAGALYYFDNVEGHLSSPFVPLTTSDQGNTDDSRPAFAQNGNTYFPIRDIIPTAQNDFGTIDQFQYYGLATPFHELDFTGQVNYDHWAPVRVSLIGEFVDNLAFEYTHINAIAVNNRAPNTASGALGPFQGGNQAWIITLKVGDAALQKIWDWDVDLGYRYVESDSLVDGFADSNFGYPLTGTNLKGYTIGGDLALGERVWLGLHLMSANSIAGPPFKTDTVQFSINGKF
ncbi:MAG: putative porin [Chthoniobacteraceae bacterium]|jgi:hypothetical protein